MTDEVLRPGFADELLARLAAHRSRRAAAATAVKTAAGVAVTASVALAVAIRRRAR